MVLNFIVTLSLTPFFRGASAGGSATMVESIREPEPPGTTLAVASDH